MSEFGHTGIIGPGFCMDTWGVGPFVIEVDGKTYRFEDSARFGPALLNKDNSLKSNPYPGERHPFWKAHSAWATQGRRTKEDGKTCIWEPLKPTNVRRIKGNQLEVVTEGDDGGEIIFLDTDKPV